jgi:hypothetical protein
MKGKTVILTIITVLVIVACAAQSKTATMEYRYTTICEWQVLGTEAQQGIEVGTVVVVGGDGCTVGRNAHAESEIKKEADQLPD